MKSSTTRTPYRDATSNRANWMAMAIAVLTLSACGGGASTTADSALEPPVTVVECDPSDPATADECGTVLVALTDADGDFLNYTVDVVSLTLETANGRVVETLPRSTRINFTDYVDLTELVSAASVPPATYVSGSITLDYSDADVVVEADGMAKNAIVTDIDGVLLTQSELRISLSNRDQLQVSKGRSALLQLDFDLAASHEVDVIPTPATAVSEQFIVAEVTPVDEKDIRVRGLLADVSEVDMTYTVAIRPFYDRDGNHGRVTVNVTDDTEIEVNGESFSGSEGLRALNAAGPGILTVAKGTLSTAEREFSADVVLAGSSVPGFDKDAVVGSIIARDGNFLSIRGATVIPSAITPSDSRAQFHDDVVVEVGPNTRVAKDGDRTADLSTDALSIGQRITVRGNQATATTDEAAPQVLFDATEGAVRMHVTHLLGMVNTAMPGQTDITLYGIDRRRADIFDFGGTGASTANDADPANYEIETGSLVLADFAAGKPVVAYGFPNAFGAAPADFTGRTIVDYTGVRSALGVGWGVDGSAMPFSSASVDGLLLNNQNTDIDQRHFIKQGPMVIDLTALASDTLIVPRSNGRALYYLKSADSLRLYSDFADFIDALNTSLASTEKARSMHARGLYDNDSNTFTAYKIGIHLLQP